MEGSIGYPVLCAAEGGFIPGVRVIVIWPSIRELGNLVLYVPLKPTMKLDNNGQSSSISSQVDKVFEGVNIVINTPFFLVVPRTFKFGQRHLGFVFQTEL